MKRYALLLVVVLFTGCRPQYSDFFPYHDDGSAKPHVAFVPVINRCPDPLPWNVADELTKDIRTDLMKKGDLFLFRAEDVKKQLANISDKELTSSKDLMPFLYFQPAHFVVLLELVDYRVVPYKRGTIKPLYIAKIDSDDASVLMMKVRLKIVDIRGNEPRIIRQEVIASNHMVTNNALAESKAVRKSAAFLSSPFGLAQARFSRDVAEKIEKITSFQRS